MENNRRADDDGRKEWNACMNSIELQKRFRTVYEDFYNVHDVVLSAPTVLTWWADVSHNGSTLQIKQKLPTKTFCGANFNDTGKVVFRNILHYSIVENAFRTDTVTSFFKHDTERISQFLEKFLAEHGYSRGITIDLLSEAPRWHGFAFTGCTSVLLSVLVHSVVEKIDCASLPNRELPWEEDAMFHEPYQFSLDLSGCISQGISNVNASNYTILMPHTALPIVFFSEEAPPPPIDTLVYTDILPAFLRTGMPDVDELPLDYGVIFTGMEHTFCDMESMKERAAEERDRLGTFLEKIIQPLRTKDTNGFDHTDIPLFDPEKIQRDIDSTNYRILEWFDHLLKHPHDESAEDTFINIIKDIGLISFSRQKENKLFFALKYFFSQNRQFEDEKIGIIPLNTGKIGGSLFFVTKSRKSRMTIQKALERLRNDGHTAYLDYASWRDGYCSDGVRIEQFISRQLYSPYTKEGNVQFADTFGKSYFGDYDGIVAKENDCILLDTIGSKIFVRGLRLTSKEIHSQTTTIDMMKLLLENVGKEIPNSALPSSSYSQNKNELVGKVVLPMRKIAKKYFWEELSLFCSGGVTNFYLRLEQDPGIQIGIIKKQHE